MKTAILVWCPACGEENVISIADDDPWDVFTCAACGAVSDFDRDEAQAAPAEVRIGEP